MFIKELEQRGLVHQVSSPELARQNNLLIYAGFDPTADSLHIGHLLPLVTLRRAETYGHQPIALIGGATGLIGDPSGKSAERNLISTETVAANVAAITKQIKRIIPSAIVVNNADWFNQINFLDFLRDTGKHFSISAMLSRDAVKSRLDSENGISFTEFTYILLQAYDFLHLNRTMNCRLQIGGSDQWGNISSGIDLIRRDGREAFGLTMPLLTNSSGEKFGKTVKGAVWLDPNKTTVNDMYQFFFNTPDSEVIKLINFFTFTGPSHIEELTALVHNEPQHRTAQIELAKSVCAFVHNSDGTELNTLDVGKGSMLIDVLIQAGFCTSRGDARNQIKQSSVKLNNTVVSDPLRVIQDDDTILTKGKKARIKLVVKN